MALLFLRPSDTILKRLLELLSKGSSFWGVIVGAFKTRPWACGFKMIIRWFGLVLLLKSKAT